MMPSVMKAANLFESIPSALPEELVEVLAEGKGHIRIVRLVSRGHASPDGFWYDQDEHEWVLVLEGAAVLAFDDGSEVRLRPGDHVNLPAHRRHRVAWTAPEKATVWLAVFYR